jgi:hypothetical protein
MGGRKRALIWEEKLKKFLKTQDIVDFPLA